VQQNFSLKTQSESVLETIKRAVEVATEKYEAAAMKLLVNTILL
jgi:hypothetical protein